MSPLGNNSCRQSDVCFCVTLPGVPGDSDHDLLLATFNEEITVLLSDVHQHMALIPNQPSQEVLELVLERAFKLMESIMAERTVAVTARIRLLGLQAGGFFEIDKAKDSFWYRILKVRSWRGTHDRG